MKDEGGAEDEGMEGCQEEGDDEKEEEREEDDNYELEQEDWIVKRRRVKKR